MSRLVTDHAAEIARNIAYWADAGAAVRRDSETADSVARWDIERESSYAAGVEYRNKVALPVEQTAPNEPQPAAAAEMRWYNDQGFYGSPAVAADISDADRRFAFSANGAYLAACRERTGEVQPDDQNEKHRKQSEELLRLSEELCRKMATAADPAAVRELLQDAEIAAASAGVDRASARAAFLPIARETAPRFNPYRQDSGFELRRYFVHSRQTDVLPSYRRIRFIPYVAQSLRAPLLSALDFWLSKNQFARFWTFTSGLRVQLSGVCDRSQWLSRRLRRLNRAKFMREAGVEIVFRSTELGTPETDEHGNTVDGGKIETDASGQMYFHVHAHCVVELKKGYIAAEKWDKLLSRVHRFWQYRWEDDGAIRSGREVCKYVTKPMEMLKLSADDLVELSEQLSGTRLVETMGSLRDEIQARDAADERLIKRKTPDGRVYYAVKDWNRHAKRTRIEENADASAKLTPQKARGLLRVVSRGVPRFGRSCVAEPCVTIMSIRGSWDENAVRAHALVAPLIQATAHAYFEGVARRSSPVLGISVHTRTLTCPQGPATPERWRSEGLHKHPIGAGRAGF